MDGLYNLSKFTLNIYHKNIFKTGISLLHYCVDWKNINFITYKSSNYGKVASMLYLPSFFKFLIWPYKTEYLV